ncbi:MAG TPA: signal recognition particle receptor subunit alpha, partial [Steroidobacteraceae bacterium]|nr:signal recognition particle receptor subunit alpha [Steroidobacteraceae bacterium]
MFDQLSQRLGTALDALRGRGRITDENIADALRQVRMALLEADVALPVVKTFIESVKARALGAEVSRSLTPGQAFIGIIHAELVSVMGGASAGLNLRVPPPLVVLLAGLQGAGKTTTAAKLALWLREQGRKRVLLVSADVHRPAAILQLERLATQIEAGFFPTPADAIPERIAADALSQARQGLYDALIVDTAGRLHVDEEMMAEVRRIDAALPANERLFVVDSMAGQDAVNAARAFGAALDLTGIVLTKADGDARGGAALSVRQVTGKPILFLGTGEKIEALETFHPERVASRILGMGDVLGLVEQVGQQVDREKAEKLARKLTKGHEFDFIDLREQLAQVRNMGGLGALLEKL